jgi:hypothetical protein
MPPLVDGLQLSMYRTEITTAGPIVCVRGDERLRITIQWAVQNSATSPFGDIRIFDHAWDKNPPESRAGCVLAARGNLVIELCLLACANRGGL